MGDLRDHLFEQLEVLKDPEKLLEKEVERAKAMCNVADRIIDSARVEVKFMETTGALSGEGFFEAKPRLSQLGNGKDHAA